jgi:hypothetical protein
LEKLVENPEVGDSLLLNDSEQIDRNALLLNDQVPSFDLENEETHSLLESKDTKEEKDDNSETEEKGQNNNYLFLNLVKVLHQGRECYQCKVAFWEIHHFYDKVQSDMK